MTPEEYKNFLEDLSKVITTVKTVKKSANAKDIFFVGLALMPLAQMLDEFTNPELSSNE